MHNPFVGQLEMENDHSHSTQETGYANNEGWLNINNNGGSNNSNFGATSHHQSPVYEHGAYNFLSSAGQHGLTMEPPSYISPRLHPIAPPSASHQQMLQPLIMPSHPTWPSELLSNNTSYSEPLPVPASTALKPAAKGNSNKLPAVHTSNPRRTLTDDDRRRMCQYNEENPHVKQTEIGAMFGVERSTVSKVLRQKEKYLYPSERTASPAKRVAKGKCVDIDRTITSWIRNQQKLGIEITDSSLLERAKFFATTVGDDALLLKINSSSWVAKFKQKHGVVGGKLTRRASTTNISELGSRSLGSKHSSVVHTPNELSPTSPSLLPSPSPLSGTRSDEDGKSSIASNGYFTFGSGRPYKHANSHSTTSLSSVFTDSTPNMFSAGPTSPTTPFAFSPDSSTAPWLSSQHSRYPLPSSMQRPRSQTFPTLDANFLSAQSVEPATPKYNIATTEPSSTVDSPMHEINQTFPLNSTMSSPPLRRSASNSSMAPPSTTTSLTGLQSTPASSAPSSPATEDLRKALDTVLTFIQQTPSSFADHNQYMTVLNWATAERSRTQQTATLPILPGGLHQIPEQEYENGPKSEQA